MISECSSYDDLEFSVITKQFIAIIYFNNLL